MIIPLLGFIYLSWNIFPRVIGSFRHGNLLGMFGSDNRRQASNCDPYLLQISIPVYTIDIRLNCPEFYSNVSTCRLSGFVSSLDWATRQHRKQNYISHFLSPYFMVPRTCNLRSRPPSWCNVQALHRQNKEPGFAEAKWVQRSSFQFSPSERFRL